MAKVAVIYFSGFGHTKKIAEHIQTGVKKVGSVASEMFDVELIEDISVLNQFDGMIFGAPTYMGAVPYQFKKFMDSTSQIWLAQEWEDKLASGFTNSYALSGGKTGVLQQLFTFAAQHSMLWMPLGLKKCEDHVAHDDPRAINRMGSSLGLMVQSDNDSPEITPPPGDCKTAELFGERFAKMLQRFEQ